MLRKLFLGSIIAFSLSSFSLAAPPARSAVVTVNLPVTSYTIPADFIGYDFEQWDLVTMGLFTTANTSLINLMKLMGSSGSIAFTGAAGDLATPPALTAQMATDLAAFMSALGNGWSLYYSLDAFCNCVATASTHVGYLQSAFGSKVTFSIGTEETDGSNFTSTTYAALWNSYYATLIAAYPTAKFACCDLGNYVRASQQIALLTGAPGILSLLTEHFFTYGPYNSVVVPTAQYGVILSHMVNDDATLFFPNAIWSQANNLSQRVTQANSVSGGGQPGISNTLLASAWFVNYAITLAREGVGGINLHNGVPQEQGGYTSTGRYIYSPLVLGLNGHWHAGPVFYGQYLFNKVVGQQIVASSVAGNANVVAMATKGGNGNANILVVNNDVNGKVSVFVDQSSAWTTATLLQTKGSAGCLETNLTVGGSAIGDDGAWSCAATSFAKGTPITLGPCEAALVQIQP